MLSLYPAVTSLAAVAAPAEPVVEAEETIYDSLPANNGAGPLWCYGSTCIVRRGDDLFASGLETLEGVSPLNNCRWRLFQRAAQGWQLRQADPVGRQREPCPLGIFADGRILLSTNPTLTEPDATRGPANPHLLQFSATDPSAPPVPLQPVWTCNPGFSEHSYRGMGVDGASGEIALFNNYGYEEQYWAFLNRKGEWSSQGIIRYPIRGCYAEVALVNRACHVLAIGDIVEPVEAWRKWKFEQSGREWDYVFRRLFYVWTPDIATTPFGEPLEIDNVDATAGHITNLDLWLDRQGDAHLLYRKNSVANAVMRDRFFPGVPVTTSLERCVVRNNVVMARNTLAVGGEGAGAEIPSYARLHAADDGRLFMFYHCRGSDGAGQELNENRLMEILPGGEHSDPVKVPLQHPFTNFMTATERGGSLPSKTLDIYGTASGKPGISCAQIRLG